MRLNWVVILLAAILILLLLVFVLDVNVSEDNDRGAPVALVR